MEKSESQKLVALWERCFVIYILVFGFMLRLIFLICFMKCSRLSVYVGRSRKVDRLCFGFVEQRMSFLSQMVHSINKKIMYALA